MAMTFNPLFWTASISFMLGAKVLCYSQLKLCHHIIFGIVTQTVVTKRRDRITKFFWYEKAF